jgi:hypothetical protein
MGQVPSATGGATSVPGAARNAGSDRTMTQESARISRTVSQHSQRGVHPGLAAAPSRATSDSDMAANRRSARICPALDSNSMRALARHTRRPLILDSFCGTGQSTAGHWPERHPEALVIGVDQVGTPAATPGRGAKGQLPAAAAHTAKRSGATWRSAAAVLERALHSLPQSLAQTRATWRSAGARTSGLSAS